MTRAARSGVNDVLLASGGLDSTVLAAVHRGALHVSVNYGQRHAAREIPAAVEVARHYGAEHLILDLPGLGGYLPCSLTGAASGLVGAPTVVPNRNAILLALAVGIAAARGLEQVLIGCNANDHDTYPDCRPGFIRTASDLARTATGVIVLAPLVHMTKRQIGHLARSFNVPTHLTWSCYAGGQAPCGTCGACRQREEALGVHDHEAV